MLHPRPHRLLTSGEITVKYLSITDKKMVPNAGFQLKYYYSIAIAAIVAIG